MLPKNITTEQRRISRIKKREAWKFFYPMGNGYSLITIDPATGKEIQWVLHHKDDTLRINDLDRYVQWNIEDLEMMTTQDHSRLHKQAAWDAGISPLDGKTEEELEVIANKKRDSWNNHSDEWKREYHEKLAETRAQTGEDNPMFGIPCTYKMTEDQIATWKANIGETMKGLFFWHKEGEKPVRSRICPGEGWERGRGDKWKKKKVTESIEQ